MSFISKYFKYNQEYPENIATNILPVGILWEYISHTFLNGFINYVTPIKAYTLTRYRPWDSEYERTFRIQDPPGSFKWKEVSPQTRLEAFKFLTDQPRRLFHTKLDLFDDDILILATAKTKNLYYFFWFDPDVSDCCIGRFEYEGDQEVLLEDFKNYAEERQLDIAKNKEYKEIPIYALTGWISF